MHIYYACLGSQFKKIKIKQFMGIKKMKRFINNVCEYMKIHSRIKCGEASLCEQTKCIWNKYIIYIYTWRKDIHFREFIKNIIFSCWLAVRCYTKSIIQTEKVNKYQILHIAVFYVFQNWKMITEKYSVKAQLYLDQVLTEKNGQIFSCRR